jgi:hypothetical protein
VIGVRTIGGDVVIAKLTSTAASLAAASKLVAVRGSLYVRKKLIEHLTGKKGWDNFWGATSPAGPFLGVRTGKTRQRISPGGLQATVQRGNHYSAAVGSPDQHMILHEYGGITSQNWIPTAAAMRGGSGTPIYPDVHPGDIPGSFIWPNARQRAGGKMKTKNVWIALAENGKLRLLFMYKQSVTHRPRGIFSTVAKETAPDILKLSQDLTKDAIRKMS